MKKLLLLSLLLTGRLLAQPVITTQPTNQIVLSGSDALFNVVATGEGLLTYQWRFNGTNLSKYTITTIAGGGNGGDGGAATSAGLDYPCGVTVDASGNILIAETGNNRIRKVDTNGVITTVAGNDSAGYSGDGSMATNASLNSPFQVAVDGAGNLYIADYDNNRIRKVDTNGVITTMAGNGLAGYSGDGGRATNASLHFPSGMALDGMGNLYAADYWNNRIRKVDTTGIITTVAGNDSTGYSGDGGQATNASLNVPNGVAFDGLGNLYIADYGNNRIRKEDLNGIITTVAGNGQLYAGGDGGAATNASLIPLDVVVDVIGNLLFTDSYGNDIRQVDTNGIVTTLVAGFNGPIGLFVDSLDNLYVADAQNNRISKVALLGSPTLTLNQVTIANAGNYDVIISDARGSVTSSVVSLTVNVPAYISAQPQSQPVSVGSNVSFSVTAGGTWPLNYQWLSNGVAIADATNSNFNFYLMSTNQAGDYSVIITNDYGSVTSSVATLTVVVIPQTISTQPASQTVPAGSNAMFSVIVSGSPPLNYQWLFNGTSLGGKTNSSLSLSNITTIQAGAYSVWVNSPYGSITSHVATLTVGWLPTITQQPTNQMLLAGSRALMVAGVSGVGPLTFQWQLNGTNLTNNLITTIAGNGTNGFSGDGGMATTGKVSAPYGVVADNAGNIFIADTANNRIRKVDANGIITTVAGSGSVPGFSGDGAAATNARLNSCYGAAVDGMGNLFIADSGNNRIRKVDTNGFISTVAGGGASFGDGGAATNAQLNYPYGVAVDTNGNLFIADTHNSRIRKVDTNGNITTIAGKSSAGFSGDGGMATNASLYYPESVALDGAGNLFIADYINSRVRKVDVYGTITTIAGNGTVNGYPSSHDGGPATNAPMNPTGVFVDGYGDVFIADSGIYYSFATRGNNRIRQVDPYGIITTVAGTFSSVGYTGDGVVATSAALYNPSGVAMDSYGRILIADTGNNRIRRFGQGPTLVLDKLTAASAGNYTLVVNSSYGSVTSLVATLTVLLPPSIIIPPASQTIGLGSNATFGVTVTGTEPMAYQWQFNSTNLPNQTSQLLNLTNVQWSNAGNYQVVITNNYGSITSAVGTMIVGMPPAITGQPTNQIVLIGSNGWLNVVVAGDGPFSYRWQFNGTNLPPIITTVAGNKYWGFSGDGGPATNAEIYSPEGVAIDAAGNLFIADYGNNRVRKVDTNGIITTVVGTGTRGNSGDGVLAVNATLNGPAGVTFDVAGNLYVSEDGNGDVRKVDANGIINRVAGIGSLGISDDGGQATNTALRQVTGVAFDSQGNMYVNEMAHCRIRKVGTNGIITTVAGNTTSITGGFSGDGGLATNAKLNDPYNIALDLYGNLLIADTDNARIRKVDATGIINTVVGGGSGYSDGLLGTNTLLSYPYGLCVDCNNNLFITTDHRVRKMDTNGIMTTVAGGGNSGDPGDYGPATSAGLALPWGLAFDAQGNLYIADCGGCLIRKVHFSGDPTLLLLNASVTNSGNYSVVITSPFGSVVSGVASLTVIAKPTIQMFNRSNGQFNLTWNAVSNLTYQVQYATNPVTPNWIDLGGSITASNGSITVSDIFGADSQRYYRLQLSP